MEIKHLNWKDSAKVIGFILVASIVSDAITYYQYRYSPLTAIIPESVMIQAAKPYLVGTIASIITTITAWTFYYFSKYKITVAVGVIGFLFNYVNYNIIGESWNF